MHGCTIPTLNQRNNSHCLLLCPSIRYGCYLLDILSVNLIHYCKKNHLLDFAAFPKIGNLLFLLWKINVCMRSFSALLVLTTIAVKVMENLPLFCFMVTIDNILCYESVPDWKISSGNSFLLSSKFVSEIWAISTLPLLTDPISQGVTDGEKYVKHGLLHLLVLLLHLYSQFCEMWELFWREYVTLFTRKVARNLFGRL